MPRYPARIFLCAYMIVEHPLAVFSQRTERELRLAAAAAATVSAFDRLLVAFGGSKAGDAEPPADAVAKEAAFDAAWCGYLELFAVWKGVDARALEEDLTYAAVELERSLHANPEVVAGGASASERQAARQGVADDQAKLRERIVSLTGAAGSARFDAAVAAARAAATQATEGAQASRSAPPAPLSESRPSNGTSSSTRASSHTTQSGASGQHSSSHAPQQGNSAADEAAAAAAARDGMLWELLHDEAFQLPTTEAEAAWSDALGETHIMQEPLPDLTGLSADAAAAATRRRVRRIADAAFWAATADGLASDDPQTAARAMERMAGILNGVGSRLLDVLSDSGGPAAAAVSAVFGAAALQERLLGAASFLDGPQVAREVLDVLQQGTQLLREIGAPARDVQLAAAQAAINASLAVAGDNRAAKAHVVANAVRLLAAQLDLLRMDVANAHLRMLAVTIAGDTGIRQAQMRFAQLHGLPSELMRMSAAGGTAGASDSDTVAAGLPKTAAWMAAAVSQLPSAQAALDAADATAAAVEAAAASAATNPAPAAAATDGAHAGSGIAGTLPPLRAGHGGSMLRRNTRSGTAAWERHDGHGDRPNAVVVSPDAAEQRGGAADGGGGTAAGWPAARLQPYVGLRSWRGAFRTGLVALVAGEARADDRAALPETLAADAARLGSAQAAFQSLLVGTAAALLLRQHASAAGRRFSAGEVEAANVRLAVLLADPKVTLPDIAAELAAAAGRPADAGAEAALQGGLQRLLARSNPGFKSLCIGLTTALTARLLAGPTAVEADSVVAAALARIGATAFKSQVEALAADIARVAALGEAVHGETYRRLCVL